MQLNSYSACETAVWTARQVRGPAHVPETTLQVQRHSQCFLNTDVTTHSWKPQVEQSINQNLMSCSLPSMSISMSKKNLPQNVRHIIYNILEKQKPGVTEDLKGRRKDGLIFLRISIFTGGPQVSYWAHKMVRPNSSPFLQQFWRRQDVTEAENWYFSLRLCMAPGQESPRPGSQPPALKNQGHQCKSTSHILPRVSKTAFLSLSQASCEG